MPPVYNAGTPVPGRERLSSSDSLNAEPPTNDPRDPRDPPNVASRRRSRWLVLAVVWIASGLFTATFVHRGWVPHDEGTLAQSAERVLRGELPHRDFDEAYTGLLTQVHAAAFRLFGTRLPSLRLVLFVSFLAFVPAVYAIALRFAPPWPAGLLALTVVAWSVPNYFASLPSWYNLFLAVFGAFAVIRHVETGRAVWLAAAGACAGLSMLVKIVGLYDVAAVLLFLAYREQVLTSGRPEARTGRPHAFLAAKIAGAGVFLALLGALWRLRPDPMSFVHFVLPGAAIGAFVVWSEWKHGRGAAGERWRGLLRLWAPFAIGAAIPVALFLVPYVLAGAVPDLFRGVFLQPFRQIGTARTPFPPFRTLAAVLPYAWLLARPPQLDRSTERKWAVLLALALGALLAFSANPDVYRLVWDSTRSLDAVAVVVGCSCLARASRSTRWTDPVLQTVFLLVCLTALVSLVQFPFSSPIYFCYVAPLVVLTLASIVFSDPRAPRLLHACVLLFYLLFAVTRANRGYVFHLGLRPEPYVAQTVLRLPRGGLRVPAADARVYEELVAAIRERAGEGGLWAGPDCPEVYFLSGYRNPTRGFFDFLGTASDSPEAFLGTLEDARVRVVVLNRAPDFSAPPGPDLRAALATRFPHAREVGKFTLLWRD
jgi:hypothetical protein